MHRARINGRLDIAEEEISELKHTVIETKMKQKNI